MDKEVQAAVKRLLRLSFMDIKNKYDGLTKSERNCITKPVFEKLVKWLEEKDEE